MVENFEANGELKGIPMVRQNSLWNCKFSVISLKLRRANFLNIHLGSELPTTQLLLQRGKNKRPLTPRKVSCVDILSRQNFEQLERPRVCSCAKILIE